MGGFLALRLIRKVKINHDHTNPFSCGYSKHNLFEMLKNLFVYLFLFIFLEETILSKAFKNLIYHNPRSIKIIKCN